MGCAHRSELPPLRRTSCRLGGSAHHRFGAERHHDRRSHQRDSARTQPRRRRGLSRRQSERSDQCAHLSRSPHRTPHRRCAERLAVRAFEWGDDRSRSALGLHGQGLHPGQDLRGRLSRQGSSRRRHRSRRGARHDVLPQIRLGRPRSRSARNRLWGFTNRKIHSALPVSGIQCR